MCCTIPLLTPKLAKPEPNRDHDGRLGALGVGQVEDRKSLGQVLLGPQGEFGGLGLPSLERLAQESFGLGLVRRVEDGADAQGDGLALIQAGDVSLGILLQVELAVLPGHAGQGRPAGGLEAGMVVGDDQADALQAAPDQAVEEGTPMDLGLGQGDGDTEHAALAIPGHADRHQYRAIDQLPPSRTGPGSVAACRIAGA